MEPDSAAVERRAKEIFKRDARHGLVTWDAELHDRAEAAVNKPALGEGACEEYRARARAELRGERANA